MKQHRPPEKIPRLSSSSYSFPASGCKQITKENIATKKFTISKEKKKRCPHNYCRHRPLSTDRKYYSSNDSILHCRTIEAIGFFCARMFKADRKALPGESTVVSGTLLGKARLLQTS